MGELMKRPGRTGLAALLLLAGTGAACGGSSPPPSTSDPSGSGERISGNERLGWNQAAGSQGELGTFRYAAYIDTGNRVELADVSCGSLASGVSPCNSRMPTMSTGSHTIELVSFVVDGPNTIESGRSAALRVNVTGLTTGGPSPTPAAPAASTLVDTSDGLELRLDVITDQLESPTAIAPATDGRVFVAEREGRVRVIKNGALDPQPAIVIHEVLMTPSAEGGLLALTLDADFERTHFVYAVYTVPASQGTRQFRVVRYREVDGRLGERIVLLDRVPAAPRPAASLGVGPDGRLYVAFDAAGGNGRVAALASYSGKILRLASDGTAPPDQPLGQLAVAADLQSPRGLDWHPATGALWVADAKRADVEELRIVGAGVPNAGARNRLTLPPGSGASDLAFYRGTLMSGLTGDLFVAAADGHYLLRMRLDPRDSTRVVSAERLLQDLGGPVRAVATSTDGTIYAATDSSVLRLGPR
jgi:glucose/arabinose dehydrogenase